MNTNKFLTATKTINAALLIVLIVALSACSSAQKTKNSKKGKTAILVNSQGKKEKINSESKKIKASAPFIRNVRYSKKSRLCNPPESSEALNLKTEEIDFELSFMIDSLNNQRPAVNKKGRSYRRLSKNMLTNLYNTPDCKQFRFKLHVISKLLNGASLESMDN